ncbi:6916_t:CDS:2, partial [Racocetra fulgida]
MATTLSENANESSSSGRLNSGQAIDQIEEELKLVREKVSDDDLDLDIVEIDLPPIKAKKREKALEAIHNIFKAERIDDKLFIKFNGVMKEEIHLALNDSLRQQLSSWLVLNDVVSVVNHNEFRPDVGGWSTRPTRQQRIAPIINSSPPPLLWIEAKDRDNALNKISYVQPYCQNTEFVLISIPFGTSPFRTNPNPNADSVVATAPRTSRPSRAPYLGHWTVGTAFNAVQWYKMQWNEHIIL